jgi:carboxyl-terminal processing protease
MQDNKRALIMGHRTFGKGSVQSVVKLGDGSGLKLTVGRYYTPSGKSIQSYGIVPDIELEDLSADVLESARVKRDIHREKDMAGHLLGDDEGEDASGANPSAQPAVKGASEGKDAGGKSKRKIQYWWTEADSKPGKELTAKDKLLKDDFQVQQAYNYLKAWSVIEDQKTKPVTPKAVK